LELGLVSVMAQLRLRDRDAIITREGIIFRVYGYSHPPKAYVCDVEYAPSSIYRSGDPRAPRRRGGLLYYKFYWNEGLRFVFERFPRYRIRYEPLGMSLVGVREGDIVEVRRPDKRFLGLVRGEPVDILLKSLQEVFHLVSSVSSLSAKDFGVFGSILHGFYHPKFSDIDLVIYGREKLRELREVLSDFYGRRGSPLKNEFEGWMPLGKRWRFKNYHLNEYVWHQRRKLIYAVFKSGKAGRTIKVEFEPVRGWGEIRNEYDPKTRIVEEGWVRVVARILDDSDSAFMPSIYPIEVQEVLEGPRADDIRRVVSYVEEFRMQAFRDEEVYVEGKLERVVTPRGSFHQITLTQTPRYWDQALKVIRDGQPP